MFLKFHIFCCVNERPDSAVRECCMKKNSLELRNYMKKKITDLKLKNIPKRLDEVKNKKEVAVNIPSSDKLIFEYIIKHN